MKKLFLLLTAIVTFAVCAAQNRTYHGTVVSASDQEPLIGASVMPVGSSTGVVTNADGQFTITVNPAVVKEVRVSYVGMKSLVLPLTDNMHIALADAAVNLDQVIVTGYGSGKKLSSVVGNVAVVGDKVFKDTPAPNFLDALQGQVTGLNINSFSGDPSATNQSVILRGINSLSLSSTPLYICDGAPISAASFNSINPNDIENVTVLKDASAIAIYGSRGANGIILITTRKGKFNTEAKVTVSAKYGWSAMVKDNVEMMNSKQYVKYRDIIGQPVSDQVRKVVDEYGINTNWRDELFKDNAPEYEFGATVRGGSEKLGYYLSLTHGYIDGIIEHSALRRTNLNFSLEAKVKPWLRMGFSGNVAYRVSEVNHETVEESNKIYVENPMVQARMAFPYDSPYDYTIDESGRPVFGSKTYKLHYSNFTTPEWLYTITHRNTNRITADMRLYEEITPIKGLIFRAQQALYAYDSRFSSNSDPYETFYTPMGDKIGQNNEGYTNPGSAQESFSREYQFTYTNTAEYTFDVAELHHIRALVGQETIIDRSNGFGVFTSGQTDKRLNLLSQGTNVKMSDISRSIGEVITNSFFLNGNYDYDNRYFLDFSWRRDGSSRLAPGHRWGNFGAFGVMWNVKNEKFLEEINWIDDLRVHYSWGVVGNASVPNFAWQGTVGAYGGSYAGQGGIGVAGASNKDLTWEKVYSHDRGFDFGFLNRFKLAATWYRKVTKDMQYDVPYSLTQGVESALANVASMSNTGVEVELNADIYKDRDWYVGARVGFNYNKNKVEELWDGVTENPIPLTGLADKVGDVSRQYYVVRYVGVDPADGRQVWLDKNDNPTKVFPADAAVYTGKSAYAPWTGGFGLNARWKGIAVSTNFVWQSGKYMINNDRYFIQNSRQSTAWNQTTKMLDIWTTPGQVTEIPRFGEELHLGDDTSWLEDASFMRMKNLTVTYNFPETILEKLHLSDLQLHFTGRNLWTVSDFSGYDPEPQTNMVKFQYPNTRQYEFGIQVSF